MRGIPPTAVLLTWSCPYYGAETFGLNALAASAVGSDPGMPPLTDAIRFGIAQSVTFVAGPLLLAVGGVLVALAVRRRGGGWSGLPFASGQVLFLSQFFGPPPVRIAHGLLVLAGCILLVQKDLLLGRLRRAAT